MLDKDLKVTNLGKTLSDITSDYKRRRRGEGARYIRPKSGVNQGVLNLKKYMLSLDDAPFFFNEIEVPSDGENDLSIIDFLLTKYDGKEDSADQPACKCRKYVGGQYTSSSRKRKICELCDSPVELVTERVLQPSMWIRCPDYLPGLIAPVSMSVLAKLFHLHGKESSIGKSLLGWLLNSTSPRPYNGKAEATELMDAIESLPGFKRGLNGFYRHFDEIVDMVYKRYVLSLKPHHRAKGSVRTKVNAMRYIEKYRHLIWQEVLPIPSKDLFVVETTDFSSYSDKLTDSIADVVVTLAGIETQSSTRAVKERRYGRTLISLAEFYTGRSGGETSEDGIYGGHIGGRTGIQRCHVYGFRCDFAYRSTITSITGEHDSCILRPPWKLFLTVMGEHIRSVLIRRGYTPNRAERYLRESISTYNVEMHEIVKGIIDGAQDQCLEFIFQRNPALNRLSIQNFRVVDVKTDVNDMTTGLSGLRAPGFAGDFDGDQMHARLSLDGIERDALRRFAPYLGNVDFQRPNSPSGLNKLPGESGAKLNNFSLESIKAWRG